LCTKNTEFIYKGKKEIKAMRYDYYWYVLLLLNATPEAKRLLERPRPRWEADIKMDLKEMDGRTRIGFVLLSTETSGELLSMVMNP
jgi:hypothetical protein